MDYFNQCVIKYNDNIKAELRRKYDDKINCKDATEVGITDEYCKDVDFHGMTFSEVKHSHEEQALQECHNRSGTLAASFLAVDNHPPPLFESDPKEDQLQLDPKEVPVVCSDYNGLKFATHCLDSCFLGTEECDHKKSHAQLNNLGNYVLFPSTRYPQEYYHDKIVITAHLFARPSIYPDSEKLPCSFVQNQDYVEGNLGKPMVTRLSNDLWLNWDTKYSHE
jgi:hypothetical protein